MNNVSPNFLESLNLSDEQIGQIEHDIMFETYNVVTTTPKNGITNLGSVHAIVNAAKLESSNERIAAAYILAKIESETKSGENHQLLRDLELSAFMVHGTTVITGEQFDALCQRIGEFYSENGELSVEEV
jgi:hypothetical protein